MSPIILLAAGGAVALYYLMKGEGEAKAVTGTVTPVGGGKVRTIVPTPDGKGYELIASKEDVAAIMAMSKSNDASKMQYMARQYRALGKTSEAQACEHIASLIALNQATGGRYTPKASTTPAVSSQPPAALVSQLVAATNAQNTTTMRRIAAQMRALGFEGQAVSIEGAAATIEQAKKAKVPPVVTTQPKTPVVVPKAPSVSVPALPMPTVEPIPVKVKTTGLPKPVPQVAATPRRATADLLVKHLTVDAPPKKKEDQSIVSAYQSAAGLKADGLYGPGTAKSLATSASGEHVPPAPRRWPKSTYAKALKEYQSWLTLKMAQDPARASEWADAKRRAKDFYP